MNKITVKGKEFTAARVTAGDSAPEIYASAEMKKYLEKLGIPEGDGAEITIRIDNSIGRDGYAVTAGEDGRIVIGGGNGRGAIYGVYALLERCAGVRYYMPGVEKIGKNGLTVDSDFSHTPIFEMRQSDWKCGNGSPDWCVKNGINQIGRAHV